MHTHELVVSLRDYVRRALQLDPIPHDLAATIPFQGPTRPAGSGGGKGGAAEATGRVAAAAAAVAAAAGMGMGGGMAIGGIGLGIGTGTGADEAAAGDAEQGARPYLSSGMRMSAVGLKSPFRPYCE